MGCDNSKNQSQAPSEGRGGARGQGDSSQTGISSSKYNNSKGRTDDSATHGVVTSLPDQHDPESSEVVPFSNADSSDDDDGEDAKYWGRQKQKPDGVGRSNGGSHVPLSSLQSSSPFAPEEGTAGSGGGTSSSPSSRPSFARKSLISSGALLSSSASPAKGASRPAAQQPEAKPATTYHSTDEIELFEVSDDPDRPAPCTTGSITDGTSNSEPHSPTKKANSRQSTQASPTRQPGQQLVPGFARQSSRLTKLLVSDVEDLEEL
jgi:hypothetical protein